MGTTTVKPQVWIGDLCAYNEGDLHGKWVDATLGVDHLHDELKEILRTSPAWKRGGYPEEFALMDFEGFGNLIGEYTSLDKVAAIAELIEEHGDPFIAWAGACEPDMEVAPDEIAELGEQFQASYKGEWDSEERFAEDYVEQCGWAGVPPGEIEVGYSGHKINPLEGLSSYLDYESIARELFRHGNFESADTSGGIYVFEREV
jgi:antirestriction protein